MKKRLLITSIVVLFMVAVVLFTLAFVIFPFHIWKVIAALAVVSGAISIVLLTKFLFPSAPRKMI